MDSQQEAPWSPEELKIVWEMTVPAASPSHAIADHLSGRSAEAVDALLLRHSHYLSLATATLEGFIAIYKDYNMMIQQIASPPPPAARLAAVRVGSTRSGPRNFLSADHTTDYGDRVQASPGQRRRATVRTRRAHKEEEDADVLEEDLEDVRDEERPRRRRTSQRHADKKLPSGPLPLRSTRAAAKQKKSEGMAFSESEGSEMEGDGTAGDGSRAREDEEFRLEEEAPSEETEERTDSSHLSLPPRKRYKAAVKSVNNAKSDDPHAFAQAVSRSLAAKTKISSGESEDGGHGEKLAVDVHRTPSKGGYGEQEDASEALVSLSQPTSVANTPAKGDTGSTRTPKGKANTRKKRHRGLDFSSDVKEEGMGGEEWTPTSSSTVSSTRIGGSGSRRKPGKLGVGVYTTGKYTPSRRQARAPETIPPLDFVESKRFLIDSEAVDKDPRMAIPTSTHTAVSAIFTLPTAASASSSNDQQSHSRPVDVDHDLCVPVQDHSASTAGATGEQSTLTQEQEAELAAADSRDTLQHMLSNPLFRRWLAAEHFTSAADRGFFEKNELVCGLETLGFVHLPPMLRCDWAVLRRATDMGAPKRVSVSWLHGERHTLSLYRRKGRSLRALWPCASSLWESSTKDVKNAHYHALRPDEPVVVYLPATHDFQRGRIVSYRSSPNEAKYIVRFENPELDEREIPDVDVMPLNPVGVMIEAPKAEIPYLPIPNNSQETSAAPPTTTVQLYATDSFGVDASSRRRKNLDFDSAAGTPIDGRAFVSLPPDAADTTTASTTGRPKALEALFNEARIEARNTVQKAMQEKLRAIQTAQPAPPTTSTEQSALPSPVLFESSKEKLSSPTMTTTNTNNAELMEVDSSSSSHHQQPMVSQTTPTQSSPSEQPIGALPDSATSVSHDGCGSKTPAPDCQPQSSRADDDLPELPDADPAFWQSKNVEDLATNAVSFYYHLQNCLNSDFTVPDSDLTLDAALCSVFPKFEENMSEFTQLRETVRDIQAFLRGSSGPIRLESSSDEESRVNLTLS